MSKLTDADREYIRQVQSKMRISKVVCTRSIKGKNGDFFVGFSSAWDTIQEDAGGAGADLINALDEGEAQKAVSSVGMTLKEAKVSGYLLAMQVDLQAQDHALAGGGITLDQHTIAQKAVRVNYTRLLTAALQPPSKVEEKG